ncbi:angiogenic factor with G patch and FHA domains 1 isoform X2 [Stomoxys calcitrans]|uniref:angiogenic factor with G patch and FHA domains 1 isoform X2 n=1 Tax=Stomoxys calcitrans TaxID=35570 RepID=UPI0027E36B31|nr:angiogenic factor with G patch and FHA domains 1 isoform X2 [Stomoxys calcitrans]
MSNSDSENTENEEKSSKAKKFHLKKIDKIKDMHVDQLHEYIENLHSLIKQHEKRLKKYKEKIRKLLQQQIESKKEVPENQSKTPSASKDIENSSNQNQESNETDGISAVDAFSFVNEMRQAAQQAENISNFVYEPTSGLYYDKKSGYYYNAEYGLYYDGNTGCYYNYNQEKNCYEFHSQVQVQASSKTTTDGQLDDNDDDDDAGEVIFDEFGVVTDREKLKRLRQEKERERMDKTNKHKKKTSHAREDEKVSKRKSHKKRKRSKKEKSHSHSDSDDNAEKKRRESKGNIEEGEISSSSTSSSSHSSESESEEMRKVQIFKSVGRFQDIAKKYPPSLRIVVQESSLEGLKVGSLSLITFKGGSLGREGNHDVIIPDVNVSKFHLKFTYDTKRQLYKCIDLGSRNGTILNGMRMSVSKTESEAYDLVHGSVLQIGQTKLLCHIHEGNSTCGLCEPGLLIEAPREVTPGTALSHKEQLKKLQKKYGLKNEKFIDGQQSTVGGGSYQDRAASRRLEVGSSSDKEKTQFASVDTYNYHKTNVCTLIFYWITYDFYCRAISSDNKGFKMLSKLGWSKGESLGKTQAGGLLEPINVESNIGTKGLGCDDPSASITLAPSVKRKMELMQKTKERYQKADIFSISDDSN